MRKKSRKLNNLFSLLCKFVYATHVHLNALPFIYCAFDFISNHMLYATSNLFFNVAAIA